MLAGACFRQFWALDSSQHPHAAFSMTDCDQFLLSCLGRGLRTVVESWLYGLRCGGSSVLRSFEPERPYSRQQDGDFILLAAPLAVPFVEMGLKRG